MAPLGFCLGLTALLAGLTGTWSPCGLSSVQTLGSGLGRVGAGRPGRTAPAVVIFALTSSAGGALTFGGAALAGHALGLDGHAAPALMAAALAAMAAVGDLRFAAVVPQIRRQVPEAVRWRLPLSGTAALYGLLLGLGFTTYLLTYAMWALVAAALLLGDPVLGLVIGGAFGVGRAIPVLVLVPRYDHPQTQGFIADMERGPTLVGSRRLVGAALVLCALAALPVAVAGSATPRGLTVRSAAADPSAAGGALAFQTDDREARLARPGQALARLPGQDPALGGALVAWHVGPAITVADVTTLEPVLTFTVPGVREFALTAGRLVYLRDVPDGRRAIGTVELADVDAQRDLYTTAASLSRPAAWGSRAVVAVADARGSRVMAIDLDDGSRVVLRRAGPGSQLAQPALHGEQLLFVRTTRCAQELRLGPVAGGRDRVVLRLRPTARNDGGFQPGYPDAYNAAGKCPRPSGPRFLTRGGILWTTALTGSSAFVTRLSLDAGGSAAVLRARLRR